MDAKQFILEFGHIASAPRGVHRLRELILALAIRGELVSQHREEEEPADVLLQKIGVVQRGLTTAGKKKREKHRSLIRDEEMPFRLPSGWAWARLANLVTVLNGRAYSKNELLSSGTPVLRVGNLFTSSKWYYSDLVLDDDKYCDKGDLLYAWSASFGPFIWQGPKAIYHYHIWKLDLHSDLLLNKRYLYTFLLEKTQEIKAAGHGISMAHMTKEKMEMVLVPVPPLREQDRIVAKVDELMALCDKLENQQQERAALCKLTRTSVLDSLVKGPTPRVETDAWSRLEHHVQLLLDSEESVDDMKQAVRELAVRGVLSLSETGIQPSKDLRELVVQAHAPLSPNDIDWAVPEDWLWCRLAWLGEARLGKMLDSAKNRGELRPYLRNVNVRWHHFDLSDLRQMRIEQRELQNVSVEEGDLVICEGGEPGRAAIWRGPNSPVIQKALHRFRCGAHVLPEYVLLCIETDYFSKRLAKFYTGATIKHLTGKALAAYSIPVPPLDEQTRIIKLVDDLMVLLDYLKSQMLTARETARLFAEAAVFKLTGVRIEGQDKMKAPKTEVVSTLRIGISPTNKEQAPLASILVRNQGELPAKTLWGSSGLEIEDFYQQLRNEMAKGWIVQPEAAYVREVEAG